jgi:hypothetical protein
MAQCLYRCSSVAQLNECGKARACGAATYSVIGTQWSGGASDNTSSRGEKKAVLQEHLGLRDFRYEVSSEVVNPVKLPDGRSDQSYVKTATLRFACKIK